MLVTKSSTAQNLLLEQNVIKKMTEQLVENPSAYLLVNPLYAVC